MEPLVIGLVALVAAGLTFFSGFGLGTVLTPAFALFFPIPVAIAATAVVHLANNLFKLALTVREADWPTVARFGAPAAAAAILGASTLTVLERSDAVLRYELAGRAFTVSPIAAVVGTLIVAFALLELWPRFRSLAFGIRWLPLGGALSGFFGGLSGNQGALRSAFLLRTGLRKEAFIATGVVAAVIVDITRLTVYGTGTVAAHLGATRDLAPLVLVAIAAAFVGSFVGKRVLEKVTFRAVRIFVALAMLVIGTALALGWV